MSAESDGVRKKTSLVRPDFLAKILSAAFVAVALWCRLAPLPYLQRQQIHQALMAIGVLGWPAAALPWLSVNLPTGGRYLAGMAGVLLGYWVQGQPLVAFTYERILFNVRLLPYLGAAALVLLALVGRIPRLTGAPGAFLKTRISSCALILALAWTSWVVIPAVSVTKLKPGSLAMPALAVSETYLFEAPDRTSLVGCRLGEVAVICGPETVLFRFPNGEATTTELNLNLESLEVQEAAGSILILDKKSGALYSFDANNGSLLWMTDGLGTVNDAGWTESFGWFLDRPDPKEDFDPGAGQIVLHRVDLISGSKTTWMLAPPEGWFWPEAPDEPWRDWAARLGVFGDSAFVQIGVRDDLTSEVPGWAAFVAIPRESEAVPWTVTQIPEGSDGSMALHETSVAGDVIVILCFREGALEVLARDIESGDVRWRHAIGGSGYYGKPMLVLQDRVLLDYSSFFDPSKTGLACLDVLTGQVMWRYDRPQGYLTSMEPVGDKTLLLYEAVSGKDEFHTDVTLLDEEGMPVWTYKAKSPAYVVRLDSVVGHVTLLEGASSQLPVSGYWGAETTLLLSAGTPVAKPGVQSDVPDLGDFRYVILDNMLYRSADRFAGDYRATKAVMRLDGPGVGIRDLIRHTDSVLAGPDFIAVACQTAEGVKVSILKPQVNQP